LGTRHHRRPADFGDPVDDSRRVLLTFVRSLPHSCDSPHHELRRADKWKRHSPTSCFTPLLEGASGCRGRLSRPSWRRLVHLPKGGTAVTFSFERDGRRSSPPRRTTKRAPCFLPPSTGPIRRWSHLLLGHRLLLCESRGRATGRFSALFPPCVIAFDCPRRI
jgi:hypothetical protein